MPSDLLCRLLTLAMTPPTPEELAEENKDIAWQAFCNNPDYSVVVRKYMFGQFRLQLHDGRHPNQYTPSMHGSIVRECCTYDQHKAETITDALCLVPDPYEFLVGLETPTNCEGPGQRIRLDDRSEDHIDNFDRRNSIDKLVRGSPPDDLDVPEKTDE